jgi:hypothetical protein
MCIQRFQVLQDLLAVHQSQLILHGCHTQRILHLEDRVPDLNSRPVRDEWPRVRQQSDRGLEAASEYNESHSDEEGLPVDNCPR